jgi:hypothetical protein
MPEAKVADFILNSEQFKYESDTFEFAASDTTQEQAILTV